MIPEACSRFFETFVGDYPTMEEAKHWEARCKQDFHSWFKVDERTTKWSKKPTILFFTSCHCFQIDHYLRTWRPEILDLFHVHYLMIHQLQLDPTISVNRMVRGLVASADIVFDNAFLPKFAPFDSGNILASAKPSLRRFSFVPPTSACWWPVVVPFGEEGVIEHMRGGLDDGQIINRFNEGTFDPQFGKRFKEQMQNLRMREDRHDVKLVDFVMRHYRTHKMWLTYNHPTYHVISHLVERMLEKIGIAARTNPLDVPTNAAGMGSHFPETPYEWEFYRLEYPIRWTEDRGGKAFYHDQIRQSYAKQKALKEPEYINPLDDL